MKLNKFLLVSIFLLAIISLGAVSAADTTADDNTTAVDDGGDLEVESPVDDGGDLEVESSVDENIVDGGDSAIGDEKLGEENNNNQPLATQEVDLNVYPNAEELDYGQTLQIIIETNRVPFSDADVKMNVTVNNKTYTEFGGSSEWELYFVTITDKLDIGEYPIEVSIYDEKNDIHGYATTSVKIVKAKFYSRINSKIIYHSGSVI